MSSQYNLAFYKQVSIYANCTIKCNMRKACKHGSPSVNCLVPGLWSPKGFSPIQSATELDNSSSPKWLHSYPSRSKLHTALQWLWSALNALLVLCQRFFFAESDKGVFFLLECFSSPGCCREHLKGQYIAPDKQIRLTSLTAAAAAQARQQRIVKLAEQRQSQGSQAVKAAQDVLQTAKATKRGGRNIQKKCSACEQHKTEETGHTITTCQPLPRMQTAMADSRQVLQLPALNLKWHLQSLETA